MRGGAGGAGLAFTVVVRETPKRCLEVSSRLLLDLVSEWMDLESIQSVDKKYTYNLEYYNKNAR